MDSHQDITGEPDQGGTITGAAPNARRDEQPGTERAGGEAAVYSSEEEAKVQERLRNLGYL